MNMVTTERRATRSTVVHRRKVVLRSVGRQISEDESVDDPADVLRGVLSDLLLSAIIDKASLISPQQTETALAA